MEILKEMPPRNPINGTFELTVRCNLKCKMCLFRHDDSENAEIMANEKTAEEWIDMARQVAEAGTLNLLITGGEPMLRPDFCEIYEGIYKQGFIITLYTNATLVTDKIIKILKKYPPHKIGVTIYGASEETYEKVCGNGKAFIEVKKGINRLKELPSKLELRTTIIKDNYKDIDNIDDLINKELNIDENPVISEIVMKSVRGGCSKPELCRLDSKENTKLLLRRSMKIVENEVGKDNFDIDKVVFKTAKINNQSSKEKISLIGCDAGMNSYTISWDGKLLLCQIFDKFYCDKVFDDGFDKSWDLLPSKINIDNINNKCDECEDRCRCTSCYASIYNETGSLDGCPKYYCENTKEIGKYFTKINI